VKRGELSCYGLRGKPAPFDPDHPMEEQARMMARMEQRGMAKDQVVERVGRVEEILI
jgi:hypothetical protein